MNFIYFPVNNPIISIPPQDLMEQAASLGTPVTAALNSASFAQVAPEGLVIPAGDGQVPGNTGGPGIPGIDNNNGAATMFITFTSLIMLVLASIFIA